MPLESYLKSPAWQVPGQPEGVAARPAELDDISVDPDTGVSVGSADVPHVIRAVQHALYQLGWAPTGFGPAPWAAFVTGGWSYQLAEALDGYRTAHAITYPPFAPSGAIDGVADSLTLRWLDAHLALLDEARVTFARGTTDEPALTFHPDRDAGGIGAHPVRGTSGATCEGIISLDTNRYEGEYFERVTSAYSPATGAHYLSSRFLESWLREGGAAVLGFPYGDSPFESGVQPFEHGWLDGRGSVVVVGVGELPAIFGSALPFKERDIDKPVDVTITMGIGKEYPALGGHPDDVHRSFGDDDGERGIPDRWNPLTDGDPEGVDLFGNPLTRGAIVLDGTLVGLRHDAAVPGGAIIEEAVPGGGAIVEEAVIEEMVVDIALQPAIDETAVVEPVVDVAIEFPTEGQP